MLPGPYSVAATQLCSRSNYRQYLKHGSAPVKRETGRTNAGSGVDLNGSWMLADLSLPEALCWAFGILRGKGAVSPASELTARWRRQVNCRF